jgi:hypothetical protein
MGRKSETRERVRELADELASQGVVPSSRKILEMLGKGSLSTITDELELWQLGPAPRPTSLKQPAAAPPIATPELGALAPMLEHLTSQTAKLLANNEQMAEELSAIRDELAQLKKTHEEQLATAYMRYEAVQRHALLQVDEARQNTGQLRERVSSLSLELDTREMAHSGKLQAVREENARLRGMLEALGHEAVMPGQR